MSRQESSKGEHPYLERNAFPVVLAIFFLLAVAYGAFSRNHSETSQVIDDRKVYHVPNADSLPLVKEVPKLYSSTEAHGQVRLAGRIGERGLWLADEEHSRKIFGVLAQEWIGFPLVKNQLIQVDGKVYRGEGLNRISPREMDASVRAVLKKQPVFIYVESLHLLKTEDTGV